VITRAGLLPTDDRARKIWHNASALVFADFWQRKLAEEDINALKKMLGVRWTREDAEALSSDAEDGVPTKRPNVIDWPLAAILEPELQQSIKKIFGRKFGIDAPVWAKQPEEDMVDLYDKPRSEFLGFVWSHVRPKILAG